MGRGKRKRLDHGEEFQSQKRELRGHVRQLAASPTTNGHSTRAQNEWNELIHFQSKDVRKETAILVINITNKQHITIANAGPESTSRYCTTTKPIGAHAEFVSYGGF